MLVKGTLDMGCLLWVQCQYSNVVAVVLHAVACYIGACCTEVRELSIARTELSINPLLNKDFAAFFMTGIPIRRYLYIETVPDRFVLICFCYCDKYIESTAMIGNWLVLHDDVIKWKHFPRYWPFVRGIHRSPVNSPHKGQWRGALMFSLICAWINGWVNNREAGDRAHFDVTVIWLAIAK